MYRFHKVLRVFFLLLLTGNLSAQTLIINKVSNGIFVAKPALRKNTGTIYYTYQRNTRGSIATIIRVN